MPAPRLQVRALIIFETVAGDHRSGRTSATVISRLGGATSQLYPVFHLRSASRAPVSIPPGLAPFEMAFATMSATTRYGMGACRFRAGLGRASHATLMAAISARNPPRGCVHHSDRGSQYASDDYRAVLQKLWSRRLHGPARQPL
jgi:hypothetical protein